MIYKYNSTVYTPVASGKIKHNTLKSVISFCITLTLLFYFNTVLPAQNNFSQVVITVHNCQNTPIANAKVILDETSVSNVITGSEHYSQPTDSNGVATFDSIKNAVYNMKVIKCQFDTLEQNNIIIQADYNNLIYLLPIAYLPRHFFVDSATSVATWKKPMKESKDLPFQDFEDELFPPSGWQKALSNPNTYSSYWFRTNDGSTPSIPVPPGNNYYAISNSELEFSSSYLITPKIDLRGSDSIYLKYQSYYLNGYYHFEDATVMYSTDTLFNWIALHSPEESREWIYDSVDLTAFTNPDSSSFYLAFFADDHHQWASGCWTIDNVLVTYGNANPNGYYVFLDNQLIDYIDHDTNSYTFQSLTYGQTYTGAIKAVYDCRTSESVEYTWTSSYLNPPLNFGCQYTYNTDEILVQFTPPDIVSSDSATNPVSFNIYLDNAVISNTPYQGQPVEDTIMVILDSLTPGFHTIKASALYDLTIYGYPGQTGESVFSDSCTQNVVYGYHLPFHEGWDIPDFNINKWEVYQNGAQWLVDTTIGSPQGAACCKPIDTSTRRYRATLNSYYLNADSIEEGNIFLDFNLSCEVQFPNGWGILELWIYNGTKWNFLKEYTLYDTTGYYNQHCNITNYSKGNVFRIRFNYGGNTPSLGNKWIIDNINIYRLCSSPENLVGDYFWFDSIPGKETYGVKICWDTPNSVKGLYSASNNKEGRSLSGFNLYRKGENEQDYNLYTSIPYNPDSSQYCFYDSYPNVDLHQVYCYKVTAVWEDFEQCESEAAHSQDTPNNNFVCVYVTGNEKSKQSNTVYAYPNPSTHHVIIQSRKPVTEIRILNLLGKLVAVYPVLNKTKVTIDVSKFNKGIYLLKVSSKHEINTNTIIVQ
ncbi:MAG: hypothetical protein DRJ09_09310 [Bacteroidetes bacterium]|nr:MAG: hypothetical protein DRJ09_09310 [Bacteroidota bacterium]